MNVKDCRNHHVSGVEAEEWVGVAGRRMARHNVGALPGRARDAGRPLTETIIMAVIIVRLRGTLAGSSTDWNSGRK